MACFPSVSILQSEENYGTSVLWLRRCRPRVWELLRPQHRLPECSMALLVLSAASYTSFTCQSSAIWVKSSFCGVVCGLRIGAYMPGALELCIGYYSAGPTSSPLKLWHVLTSFQMPTFPHGVPLPESVLWTPKPTLPTHTIHWKCQRMNISSHPHYGFRPQTDRIGVSCSHPPQVQELQGLCWVSPRD